MTNPLADSCEACGRVQLLPQVPAQHELVCERCDAGMVDPRTESHDLTPSFAFALAGLVLYPSAISLPIMELERMGHRSEASVLSGSLGLFEHGDLLVGALVFLCSVVFPAAKLISLLVITSVGPRLARAQRRRTWHFVELTGRWGMLDVLLIACLAAWLKLGDLVHVSPGPGMLAFALCVLASLLASAYFHPKSLWVNG
jgi:paraquat-inducible protein A